jgi:hypothetical protein
VSPVSFSQVSSALMVEITVLLISSLKVVRVLPHREMRSSEVLLEDSILVLYSRCLLLEFSLGH